MGMRHKAVKWHINPSLLATERMIWSLVAMISASEMSGRLQLDNYKYTALQLESSLRLLRLRPASDEYQDIDIELAEFKILENGNDVLPPAAEGKAKGGKENTKVSEKLSYEAVSWCWGKEKPDQLLRVHENDKVYAFYVSKNLKTALWALRKNDEVRQLWIDAICIDQKNLKERNKQVPRMDEIYGSARSVCIWLGDADDESGLAMHFIKHQVLSIWEFDKLIENRKMARQWHAFINLMKRPWFSRRWVVQEIALKPSGGTLYCGKDAVSWSDFADAVSLFVEVESATHRLSDVMKRNEFFGHMSEFFGDVSSLGAALLVDATSNLFRNSQTGERKPLSTLEYLVSRLSVFEASQPRDTIYALLAISKDTTPRNIEPDLSSSQATKKVMAWAQRRTFTSQPYIVDYKLPVIDVYKQFIEFSIRESDKTRALDIICRPWAPTVLKRHDKRSFQLDPVGATKEDKTEKDKKDEKGNQDDKNNKGETDKKLEENDDGDDDDEVPLPSWIPTLSGAAFEMEEHPTIGFRMERQNADPLVGLPESGQTRNYSAAGTKTLDVEKFGFLKWTVPQHQKEGTHYPEYSMFVQGFVLDEVSAVEQIASNGNMPYRWLKPGGWFDTDQKPPDAFWRTLVADRGPHGRNPPTYFPRACQESMKFKAKTKSKRGNLDSKKLIHEGKCTIVAEFLRRVQAVIWNRLLMTTKEGRLGLVRDDVKPGYMVCILYGCSVPVILQKMIKSDNDVLIEQEVLYKEWLEKRKRVAGFFTGLWRMLLRRRTQGGLAPPKKMPKSSKEALDWLQSPRKPATSPSKTNEYPELDQSPLISGTPSKNKAIIGDGKSSTNKMAPEDVTTSTNASTLEDQGVTRKGTGFQTSFGDEAADDGETKTFRDEEDLGPDKPKPENLNEDDLQGKNSDAVTYREEEPQGEAPEVSQLKGKQKEKNSLKAAALMKKEWQEMSLPQRKELGRKQAEASEREEKHRAMPSRCYYRFVGECYVHGVMNGEAIALQNIGIVEKKMLPEEFELR